MSKVIRGKAFVVRDNIDTDHIIPARVLYLVPTIPEEYEKLGSFALCGLPKDQYPTRFIPEGQTRIALHDCHRRTQFRVRQFARARADCAGRGGLRGGGGGKFCAHFFPQQRGDG